MYCGTNAGTIITVQNLIWEVQTISISSHNHYQTLHEKSLNFQTLTY